VVNLPAVDPGVKGYKPAQFVYAQVCDGVPGASPKWSPGADCGPATAAIRVANNGTATFPGTSTSYDIVIWHGSDANNSLLGEMPFDCLAADDNPRATTTADGKQPIDPAIPAWGSTKGGDGANPSSFDPSNPCQIRFSTNEASYSPSDLFVPIDLGASGTASLAAAQSGTGSSGVGGVAIAAIAVGAVLVGGIAWVWLRRLRRPAI
jgi:hypothetical protein